MQPLYLAPAEPMFEKNASEVTLPENANAWPNEIMQELYKQVPYIADFDPEVVMDRVDAERAYGFGHVEVKNKTELQHGASEQALQAVGIQQVRIPVIIKNRKLYPFDIIITAESKALPLTETRIRQALFRPQAFDVTSRTPGDMSMVGQLYPPYRQNYGGGGGGVGMSAGMGKESSALEQYLEKEAGLLQRASETVARESALGTRKGLGAAAENIWKSDKGKVLGGVAAATGLVAANKGINYALNRHRDKRLAKDIALEVHKEAGLLQRASETVARESALGTRKGLGAAAENIWKSDKGKVLGGVAAATGLVAANKGINYALNRHRDKRLAKDIALEVHKEGSSLGEDAVDDLLHRGGPYTDQELHALHPHVGAEENTKYQRALHHAKQTHPTGNHDLIAMRMHMNGSSGAHLAKRAEKCAKCGSLEKCACVGMGKRAAATIPNSTLPDPKDTTVRRMVPKLKHASVLSAILPTINVVDYTKFASALEEPGLRALYLRNKVATAPAITLLSGYDPAGVDKTASALSALVRPNVVQVIKLDRGYQVKTASTEFWQPQVRVVDRGEAVQMLGSKVVLAADMTGAVTVTEGDGAVDQSPESKPEIIASFGLYRVKDDKGQELVGFVFPNLLDTDGTPLPIALFSNGSATAMQESIAGEAVGKDSGLIFGPPSGYGMFVRQLPNGGVDAMVPMTIKGGYAEGGSHKLHVETYDGREMFAEQQPNIQSPTDVDGTCIVPETFRWMSLGGDAVDLVEHPEQWGQAKEASRSFASVVIRSDGTNTFSLTGIPVEKLASSEKQFLHLDDAMFLLAGLGTNLDYASEKLAESVAFSAPVQVRVGRYIKTAQDQRNDAVKIAAIRFAGMPNLRCSLIKEAAFIPDPSAVDTVLSVGFINPENIMTFVSYLPQLDASQERLCELLVAARLGLSDVPTSPLEKSIKSLEEVLEGLKVLAFQKS